MAKNILVADDDDSMRKLHEKILSRKGYKVHSVRNGLEAYNFMDANKDLINLVLTDFDMPIMWGDELTEKLRDKGCKIPIILFSGWLEEDVKKKYPNPRYTAYIKKPFDMDKYLDKVHECLNSEKPKK